MRPLLPLKRQVQPDAGHKASYLGFLWLRTFGAFLTMGNAQLKRRQPVCCTTYDMMEAARTTESLET